MEAYDRPNLELPDGQAEMIRKIAQAHRLENVRITQFGDDTVISGYVVKE